MHKTFKAGVTKLLWVLVSTRWVTSNMQHDRATKKSNILKNRTSSILAGFPLKKSISCVRMPTHLMWTINQNLDFLAFCHAFFSVSRHWAIRSQWSGYMKDWRGSRPHRAVAVGLVWGSSGHKRVTTPASLRTENWTAPIFWMRVVASLYSKSYSDSICIHEPDSEVPETTTAWTVPCSQEFKSEDAVADKRWLRDHKLRFQSLSDDWP